MINEGYFSVVKCCNDKKKNGAKRKMFCRGYLEHMDFTKSRKIKPEM